MLCWCWKSTNALGSNTFLLFPFHQVKSFHVFALREIKHIQFNYATYRQKPSKCETLCSLYFTVAIGNGDKLGKLQSSLSLGILMALRASISWVCSFFLALCMHAACVQLDSTNNWNQLHQEGVPHAKNWREAVKLNKQTTNSISLSVSETWYFPKLDKT